MSHTHKVIPVVMCGGAGTRLWPVSRDSMPKQFISLFGDLSTFQRAMRLLSDPKVFERPIVITNAEYRFTVQDQLKEAGVDADIVLEPVRRNSAPAVAVAAELGLQRNPDAVVGVFAADHVVQNGDLFVSTCAKAAEAASAGYIATIGIPPTVPATGYGYIQQGDPLPGVDGVRRVAAFVEKPSGALAAQYIADGYLWNSGNFIFSAQTMRQELERFAPNVLGPAADAVAAMAVEFEFMALPKSVFEHAESVAIDVAVMEKTDKAVVVPGGFGWSDVGGWQAVWDVLEKDHNGNAISGRGYVVEGKNNLLRSDGAVVAVVGLDDVAVISTRDAVLVLPKNRGDQVRDVVEAMRRQGEAEAAEHREMHRPWGKYVSIDVGARHQVKRITVKPGGILSLQKHFHRAEHWIVVRGTAEVTRDEETLIVHENESIYLPIGCVHRMANPGKIPLEIIEVQVGSYLGEDDIVRLVDVYKRV